jgi:fructose-1,6-bisphosphatase I
MLYGGIYGYPRDAISKNGKLRLLYECAPMSYLAEQAGGKGSDGHQRVLDIQPEEVCKSVTLNCDSSEMMLMKNLFIFLFMCASI